MTIKENIENLEKVLAASGLEISKEVLKENYKNHPDGFEMRVTRQGKKELEDSTLYFRKSGEGVFTHTEIKEKNFSFLANQMLDAEMDAMAIVKLREGMIKGLAEIQIDCPKTVANNDTLSKLNFSYFPANGFHYWNDYQFQILGRAASDLAGVPQTVFIDKEKWTNNFTPSEMTELLLGKTITKEFVSRAKEFYVAERKLDFNSIDKHGNFAKVKPETPSVSNTVGQQPNSSSIPLNQTNNQKQNPETRRPRRNVSFRH